MNALTIVSAAAVPSSLAEAELDAALSFAEQEKSAATRRAYRSEWRIFTAWCALRDLEPLPAAQGTVARFLSSQATAGVKASTISRRYAAIGYAHKLAGHREAPNAETVKAVMRGIRRAIGTASARRRPPRTADSGPEELHLRQAIDENASRPLGVALVCAVFRQQRAR
jgi:hypothetical protein